MRRRGWTIAVVVPIAAAALAGAAVASSWTPTVPDDAAVTVVARTVLQGDIAPDATGGVDPDSLAPSPVGQACLDPIERPAGPMSLCWEAFKDPRDGDPLQDYYRLQVHATFGGESGTGVRWAVVRAQLVGQPSNEVFQGWPDGVFEGPCRQVGVSLGAGPDAPETVCGRTTGSTSSDAWGQRVTWTCVGCLLADHADRSITLKEFLAVPAGTVPTWEIFADLGT